MTTGQGGAAIHGVVVDCGPCPYLPDRQFHAFQPTTLPEGVGYRQLMDHRFRRSGTTLYLPSCPTCSACQPMRVATATFEPRADQRRSARRNADLVVTWSERGCEAERTALWRRYEMGVHHRSLDEDDDGASLALSGAVPGGELHARDATGRLLAVSVLDVFADAVSSVYCYYDPDERGRGLGTFMAVAEIAWAAGCNKAWWYPGFLVTECSKMSYKARFGPHQVLHEGVWVSAAQSLPGSANAKTNAL